jgi:hypothetical protein
MTGRSFATRTSIAALAAASLIATTSGMSPATAATATAAATSSSATVIAGRTATLTLTLRSATTGAVIPGVVVKLWSRPSSSAGWVFVASTTTSSSGVASVVIKPLHNTQYVWTFAGNSQYQPVTSSVVNIVVAQGVSINANHPSATTINIWGAVTPDETGQTVVLQRLLSGTWRSILSATIKSQVMPNGHSAVGYSFHLGGFTPGTYTYRATRAATSSNGSGVSATLIIRL